MAWLKRNWFLLVAGVLAGIGGLKLGISQLEPAPAGPLEALWSAELADLSGRKVPMRQYKGEPLIINFWATWCGPCKEEMPDFQRVAGGELGKKVRIIGIGIDDPAKMASFSKELSITYDLLQAGTNGLDLMKALGNRSGGLPYTIAVSRAGVRVLAHTGQLDYNDLRDAASKAIAH